MVGIEQQLRNTLTVVLFTTKKLSFAFLFFVILSFLWSQFAYTLLER